MTTGLKDRLFVTVASFIGALSIRFLNLTIGFTHLGKEPFNEIRGKGGKVIFAFWHGRLMMMPVEYGGPGLTVLASRHRDGELVARALERFGIESIRGSSSRGWFSGVKGLLKAARSGRDLGIVPDGPRGPARVAQMGAVLLAKSTGMPIIPLTFSTGKKKLYRAGIPFMYQCHSQRVSLSTATLSM